MGNLKLVDAGVFLYKKWKPVLFIGIAVMIVTVLVACLLGNPYSAQLSSTFFNNPQLNGLGQNVANNTVIVHAVEAPYPQDTWAVEYVESIKPSKTATGRVNPFRNAELFSESKLAAYFGTEGFKAFMTENEIDPSHISVLVTSNTITVTSLDKDKEQCSQNLNRVMELCSEYIDDLYKQTIADVRTNYQAMLDIDQKEMQAVLDRYESVKGKSGSMAQNEEGRRLLNEYAQIAYDYDVACATIAMADDLTKISLKPVMVVNSVEYSSNLSPIVIACYAVIGLIVGLILGGFAAFVGEYCKTVKKKASESQNAQ